MCSGHPGSAFKIAYSWNNVTMIFPFAFHTFFQMKHFFSLFFPNSGFLLTLHIKKKKNKNRKRLHDTLLLATWRGVTSVACLQFFQERHSLSRNVSGLFHSRSKVWPGESSAVWRSVTAVMACFTFKLYYTVECCNDLPAAAFCF